MQIVIVPLALLLLLLAAMLILPFSIRQRYRSGTSTRPARSWLALLNAISIGISIAMLLIVAAIAGFHDPGAIAHALSGLLAGSLAGAIGLRLTRWETVGPMLHYTPNRWLVLTITVAVGLRLVFGLWRAIQAWTSGNPAESWLAESGISGSLAAGAFVLGYYFTFWIGVGYMAKSCRRRSKQN